MAVNVDGAVRVAPVSGFVPFEVKDTGMVRNPVSGSAHAAAIQTVLLYTLADSFDLRPEEVGWASHVLGGVCGVLSGLEASSVPFAARQEMLNGTYTRLLELRENAHIVWGQTPPNPQVVTASRSEWVEVLVSPIVGSYELPPMVENAIRVKLGRLLADLGVGDAVNPRQATHLPSELLHRIAAMAQQSGVPV